MKKSLILYQVFSKHKTMTVYDKDEKKLSLETTHLCQKGNTEVEKNYTFPKKYKSIVNLFLAIQSLQQKR